MNLITNKQIMNKTLSRSLPRQQRGAMTLLISLVILTLITFISLYTSRTVSMEQKISGNEFRSRQAFEAADAGLEAAMSYLPTSNGGTDRDKDGVLDDYLLCTSACAGSDGGAAPADVQGDTFDMTLANGSTVRVFAEDVSADGDMTQILIESTGTSSDGTATRTVSLIVPTIVPLPGGPDNPLTARGSVVIDGSATVHNPEGHSTIWSGDNVDLGGNNATATEIADPGDANYPECLGGDVICDVVRTSDKDTMGLDVIEEDSSLANLSDDEFFENFFGMSPTAYQDTMVSEGFDLTNSAADLATIDKTIDQVIWITGDVDISNFNIGCDDDIANKTAYDTVTCPDANRGPEILIIDGNLNISGGAKFLGLVYVTGTINISGNNYFEGALVVSGGTGDTSGSLDVWYNSSYLEALAPNGPKGGAAGTWRDF